MTDLVQAWLIHNRVNTYVCSALTEEQWQTLLAKGKAVNSQFTHIVSVRLMWLKAIDPGLVPALSLDDASPQQIVDALNTTAQVVAEVIAKAQESGKPVKNFKPTVEAFVGYLISHEAAHRAMAEIALRQAGLPLDDKVAYGQWEWGSRSKEL